MLLLFWVGVLVEGTHFSPWWIVMVMAHPHVACLWLIDHPFDICVMDALHYMFGIMVLFLVYCSSCLESATSMFMYDGSSPLRGWIMMMWGSDMDFVWSTLVIIDGLLVTWYISLVHGVIFVCRCMVVLYLFVTRGGCSTWFPFVKLL